MQGYYRLNDAEIRDEVTAMDAGTLQHGIS